jgi:hypothetical protein
MTGCCSEEIDNVHPPLSCPGPSLSSSFVVAVRSLQDLDIGSTADDTNGIPYPPAALALLSQIWVQPRVPGSASEWNPPKNQCGTGSATLPQALDSPFLKHRILLQMHWETVCTSMWITGRTSIPYAWGVTGASASGVSVELCPNLENSHGGAQVNHTADGSPDSNSHNLYQQNSRAEPDTGAFPREYDTEKGDNETPKDDEDFEGYSTNPNLHPTTTSDHVTGNSNSEIEHPNEEYRHSNATRDPSSAQENDNSSDDFFSDTDTETEEYNLQTKPPSPSLVSASRSTKTTTPRFARAADVQFLVVQSFRSSALWSFIDNVRPNDLPVPHPTPPRLEPFLFSHLSAQLTSSPYVRRVVPLPPKMSERLLRVKSVPLGSLLRAAQNDPGVRLAGLHIAHKMTRGTVVRVGTVGTTDYTYRVLSPPDPSYNQSVCNATHTSSEPRLQQQRDLDRVSALEVAFIAAPVFEAPLPLPQ